MFSKETAGILCNICNEKNPAESIRLSLAVFMMAL